MKKRTVVKILKRIGIGIVVLAIFSVLFVIGVNLYVMAVTSKYILTDEEAAEKTDIDCIIVLGAAVKPDGTPSLMLSDRLDKAYEIYEKGICKKIIVSGDHSGEYYDEVNTMKKYLIDKGVPSEDIFMDHAGLSTYDTMYRAANIFGVKSAIVITQEYHMYRALYNAWGMGIDAYGVCAKKVTYGGQTYRDIREAAARIKDVGYCIIKPEATIMGEKISLENSGDVTNDEK